MNAPRLTAQFEAALVYDTRLHSHQTRKVGEERKTRYLENLRHASPAVRRVSLADKLHNARSLLAQWRQKGDTIWSEFTGGKEGILWFYRSLVQVYRETGSDLMTDELDRVVLKLCQDDKQ